MPANELPVKEIAERVLGASPEGITQVLGKGFVNTTFVVDVPGSRFVLRISPNHNIAQFQKEAWATRQARKQGVATPRVVDVGEHDGTVYMVQEFVAGTHGTDRSADQTDVWRELGRLARAIHTIATEGFGDRLKSPGAFQESWNDHLDYNIRSLDTDDALRDMNVLTIDQSREVRDRFVRLASERLPFGLNHGDLSLKNAIVDDSGTVFLLDWGSAESHIVPHFEFMELLRSRFNLDDRQQGFVAFTEGYGLDESGFVAMRPLLDTLMLLRAIDKLRWAIDRNPERIGPFKRNVRRVLAYTSIA